MSLSKKVIATFAGFGTAVSAANASIILSESNAPGGDAGNTIATAFNGNVPGGQVITSLTGTISNSSDVDIWAIRITNPAAFSATHTTANFNSMLSLFDANGLPVAMGDDINGTRGAVTGQFVPAAGNYFIVFHRANRAPVGINNNLFWNGSPANIERAPDSLGTGSLAGFTGTVPNLSASTYEITITGGVTLPAPTAVALLGLGGLAANRRRR